MTRRITLAVAVATFAVLAGAIATRPVVITQPAQGAALEPSRALLVLTGHDSQVTKAQFRPAASQKVFDELWLMHKGDSVTKAAQGWPMIPQIDFNACYAIFIFGGDTANTNGYRVRDVITEVDAITVRYETDSYQTSSFNGIDHGNAVRPWGLILIPAPKGRTVILEQNVQGMRDTEPKWKQRVTFPGRIGIGRTIGGTSQHGSP